MTEKRFKIDFDGKYFNVVDIPNERCLARLDTKSDADAWLETYEILLKDKNNFEHQMRLEKGNAEYYKQLFEEKCKEYDELYRKYQKLTE